MHRSSSRIALALVVMMAVMAACSTFDHEHFRRDVYRLMEDTSSVLPIAGMEPGQLTRLPTGSDIVVVSSADQRGRRSIARGEFVGLFPSAAPKEEIERRREQVLRDRESLPAASLFRQIGTDPRVDSILLSCNIRLERDRGQEIDLPLFRQDAVIAMDGVDAYDEDTTRSGFLVVAIVIGVITGLLILLVDSSPQPASDNVLESTAQGCSRSVIILLIGAIGLVAILVFGLMAGIS